MAQRVELHEKNKRLEPTIKKKMLGPTPLRDLRKNPDSRMDRH